MSDYINPSLLAQKVNLESDCFQIAQPFCLALAGSSSSGKSHFLFNLVKHRKHLFAEPFHRIIYCHPTEPDLSPGSYWSNLKKEYANIEFCIGLPSLTKLDLHSNRLHTLLMMDDLMVQALQSPDILEFATQHSHHRNISCTISLQNYFLPNNKYGRSFIKNCNYRVFFYNRLENRELAIISSQIANCSTFFQDNFEFLINKFPNDKSYYLLIDGHYGSSIGKSCWCRSKIFPIDDKGEIIPIVFLKNPNFKK